MPRLALHWQILIGMVLGAAVGLTLNWQLGQRSWEVTVEYVPDATPPRHRVLRLPDRQELNIALPKGIQSVKIRDTADRIDIEVVDEQGPRQWAVDGTQRGPRIVASLGQLRAKDPQAYTIFQHYGRSWARWVGDQSQALGGLFLRLLQMVAVPLIVTSLVTGVMGLGHAGRLGRMFGRTVLYYLSTSMLAIVTGLVMVNLIRPGLNSDLEPQAGDAPEVGGELGQVLFEQVQTMIPTNPIEALAEGNFLSIICFSLAFAIFALIVGGRTAELVRDSFSAGFEVMMAMTTAIIKLAPVGVLFLMLYVTATQGPGVFQSLFWYMLTVLAALGFHALVVLPLIVWFVARRSPWQFAKAMSPALLTAFSSASSNGTLPLTLASVEQRAGVSNRVSSFVLPLGATVNMDGTALYEAVAVLFIAQLYRGQNLPLSEQILVAVTALLASVGAAGIPHAGLVMMVIILKIVGLPLELQGIILAVDRLLDMARTSVNVWSDSCGCAVVARFETGAGELPPGKTPEPELEGSVEV